jgi:hypothetical protein
MGLDGEIRLMTEWQIPTHSLPSPKSVRNTIGLADGIGGQHAPAIGSMQGQDSVAAPAMIDWRAATWLSKRFRPTGVKRARTRLRRSLTGRSIVT